MVQEELRFQKALPVTVTTSTDTHRLVKVWQIPTNAWAGLINQVYGRNITFQRMSEALRSEMLSPKLKFDLVVQVPEEAQKK